MKLSDDFRVTYWKCAFGVLTAYVALRMAILLWCGGEPTKPDMLLGGLWAVFALVPIFSIIKFAGVSIEQHPEPVSADQYKTPKEIASLRHALEAPVERLVQDEPAAAQGVDAKIIAEADPTDSWTDADLFFKVRRKVDAALEDLGEAHGVKLPIQRGMNAKISTLVNAGCLPEDLVTPLRVLYDVCNRGLHGEHMTESQVAFVRSEQKRVIEALRALAKRPSRTWRD